MGLDLERDLSRFGLTINTNETILVSLTGCRALPICTNEQSIEGINQFAYLGSVVWGVLSCCYYKQRIWLAHRPVTM